MHRYALLAAVICILGLTGLGERIQVEAPWLTAYDPQGRPVWELSAVEVEGTAGDWIVREAQILFFGPDGEEMVEARVAELTADPTGTRWESASPVEGEGEDFRFHAQEARWEEGTLTLKGLAFTSGELVLQARMATWRREGIWELVGVAASFGEWELEFSRGIYRQGEGTLEIVGKLVARGWGWEVEANGAVVDIPGERVTLQGVRIVEA